MSKNLIFIILISFAAFGNAKTSLSWQQVLEVNKKGEIISGDKQTLVDAIRKGQNIRVYWKGSYVEHLTDAHFLTIIEDEVFAQTPTIRGQKPHQTPPSIELRENNWTGIVSTTGKFHSKWFVQE